MKVIFLTPTLEMHGGNVVLAKYASFLIAKGHEVIIIANDQPIGVSLDPKIKILCYKKFPIKLIDFFSFQLVYLLKISRLIEDCDFIIPIYTPLFLPALWAKKRRKVGAKILIFFQDCYEMIWVGPFLRWLTKRKIFKNNVSEIIAVSNPIAKELRNNSGLKAKVIPNGVEHELFFPRKLKKKNYILFVGRPQIPKGFPTFKKALNKISTQFPEMKAKIVSPGLEKKIIGNLEFVPYENRIQLAKLYNQAMIYVNASVGESFGLPSLEAMVSGTAVVLTDTLGSQQYAKDNKNCLIVPTNNVEKLAGAITDLLTNKSKRIRLQKNGLATAKQFKWERSEQDFLNNLVSQIKLS